MKIRIAAAEGYDATEMKLIHTGKVLANEIRVADIDVKPTEFIIMVAEKIEAAEGAAIKPDQTDKAHSTTALFNTSDGGGKAKAELATRLGVDASALLVIARGRKLTDHASLSEQGWQPDTSRGGHPLKVSCRAVKNFEPPFADIKYVHACIRVLSACTTYRVFVYWAFIVSVAIGGTGYRARSGDK